MSQKPPKIVWDGQPIEHLGPSLQEHGLSIGRPASDDGPFLADLSAEQRAQAVLEVRCEHDRSVVAIVLDGSIISSVERVPRSTHDVDVLVPCSVCPLHVVVDREDGRRVRQAERWASSRLIWQQVDRRRPVVPLDKVLAARSLVRPASSS